MTSDVNTCEICGAETVGQALGGLCPECLLRQGLEPTSGRAGNPQSPTGLASALPSCETLNEWFPQLNVIELVGIGGMGAVYRARQVKLDRMVALKVIHPQAASDPAFAERFAREARTLARLDHPNIVSVHDFGELHPESGRDSSHSATPFYYFVMEYVEGANLRLLLNAEQLSPAATLSIISQVCDALQFAHNEGVIHRDIKPENILVDQRGTVKIADFGLAKLASSSGQDVTLTRTQQVMGTPRYMAPEQMAGQRVDHRADIYSLGVVFYEMLTGQIPAGHFDSPSRRSPVDARLDDVVMRALSSDPDRRFQQVSEIRQTLDQLATESVLTRTSSRTVEHSEAPTSRHLSTVLERESELIRDWFRADDAESRSGNRPFPQLLMMLVCLAGCCTALLPWIRIEIPDTEVVRGTHESLLTRIDNQPQVVRELDGSDSQAGRIVAGLFAVATVLLLTSSSRRGLSGKKSGTIVALAGMSLLMTMQFPSDVETLSISYRYPSHIENDEILEWGTTSGLYRDIEHRSLRQAGYYVSLSLSLVLLVLGSLGLKHAAVASPTSRETRPSTTGRRLSPPAMAGSVLLALSVLFAIRCWFLFHDPRAATWMSFFVAAMAFVTGLTASGLGLWSLIRIRSSNGREWGRPLAFLAFVGSPMLALNVGMVGLINWLASGGMTGGETDQPTVLWVMAGLVIPVGLVDWLIVYVSWKKLVTFAPDPGVSSRRRGTPFASVRFEVPDQGELAATIKFHFESLGYQLVSQTDDEFHFQRGSLLAGLCLVEIERMLTNLTVKVARLGDGQTWISCSWRIVRLGSVITGKDRRKIDNEGFELQRLLNRLSTPDRASETFPSGSPAESAATAADNAQASGRHSSFFLTALQYLLLFSLVLFVCGVMYVLMNRPDTDSATPATLAPDVENSINAGAFDTETKTIESQATEATEQPNQRPNP